MDKQGNSTNENAYHPASEGIDNVHEQLRTRRAEGMGGPVRMGIGFIDALLREYDEATKPKQQEGEEVPLSEFRYVRQVEPFYTKPPLQYRLLFKERKRRAKIADAYAKRAGRRAVLAAVNGDDGALRVWSHAQSIYARARNSLRARARNSLHNLDGRPQEGAPR